MSTDWNLGCEYHREAVWAASTSGSVRKPCFPHLVSAFIYRHRACVLKVVGDSHDFHDWTDWAHANGDGVPEEMDECGVDDDSRRLACRICDRQPVTPPHSVCRACWDKNDWCHDEAGPEEE